MGVFPEPALCADDVCRLVSYAPGDTLMTACPRQRPGATARWINVSPVSGYPLRALSALLLGLALAGVSVPATAREGALPATSATPTEFQLRLGDAPSAWGSQPLLDEEPAANAVREANRADPASPKTASGEAVIRFGEKSVPRNLVETIVRAAEATGVEPAYMMALADKESNFDTDVKNSASSAQGLFQFVSGTWLEMVRDYGAKYGLDEEASAIGRRAGVSGAGMRKRILALRNDPYVAGLMAGELIKRDRAKIESRIGRGLKTTELYIAHFLGTASAGKFLVLREDNPEKVAASEFKGAARANRSLFKGNGRALTVAQLHERLDGMIDRRIEQYERVAEVAAPVQDPPETLVEKVQEETVLDARLRIKDAAIPEAQ